MVIVAHIVKLDLGQGLPRRVRWWCKLIFPSIDTHRTRFVTIPDGADKLLVPVAPAPARLSFSPDDWPLLKVKTVVLRPELYESLRPDGTILRVRCAYDQSADVCGVQHVCLVVP